LSDAYISSGDYKQAVQLLQEALEADPDLYYSRNKLVHTHILLGQYQEAEELLQIYLEGASEGLERAALYGTQAFLRLRQGDLQEALRLARLGLQEEEAGPYRNELLWLLGRIELKRGNLPAVESILDSFRQQIEAEELGSRKYKPALKFWLHLRATLQAAQGNRQQAAQTLQELDYIKEKFGYWGANYGRSTFYNLIGNLYEQLDLPAEAEQTYREGLAYNGSFALTRHSLGRLLLAQDRPDEARSELEAFLALWRGADPAVPELRMARQLIR
jgi:tetratricopeptide (TPR) repeat protein